MVNPFSTKFWTAGVLPFQFNDQRETAAALLEKADRFPVCQIVGQHGSGKSTLLQHLQKRYQERGSQVRYFLFNGQNRQMPADAEPQGEAILFVDGFEQLPIHHRLWLRCRSKRLILTAHRPVWFVPVLYQTEPRFSVFVQLVRQLTPFPPEEPILRSIFDKADGNFRNCFFELYDIYESEKAGHGIGVIETASGGI